MRDELEGRCDELEDQLADAVDEIKVQHINVYQYRMYKAKSEFLEKESAIHLHKLHTEVARPSKKGALLRTPTTEEADALDALLNAEGASLELVQALKDKLVSMAGATNKAQQDAETSRIELAKLKESGLAIEPEILETLQLGNGATKKALVKLMGKFRDGNVKLMQIKEENTRLNKNALMLQKRDEYNEELRNNWRGQLQQMEQAVTLCSQIHMKERSQYEKKLMSANTTVKTLKEWVCKIKQRNARHHRTMLGSRIRVPGEGANGKKTLGAMANSIRKMKAGHKIVKRRKRNSYDITDKRTQLAKLRR